MLQSTEELQKDSQGDENMPQKARWKEGICFTWLNHDDCDDDTMTMTQERDYRCIKVPEKLNLGKLKIIKRANG